MRCASEMHLKASNIILRYIKRTVDYGVKFEKCQNFKFSSFLDSDWGRDIDNSEEYFRILF